MCLRAPANHVARIRVSCHMNRRVVGMDVPDPPTHCRVPASGFQGMLFIDHPVTRACVAEHPPDEGRAIPGRMLRSLVVRHAGKLDIEAIAEHGVKGGRDATPFRPGCITVKAGPSTSECDVRGCFPQRGWGQGLGDRTGTGDHDRTETRSDGISSKVSCRGRPGSGQDLHGEPGTGTDWPGQVIPGNALPVGMRMGMQRLGVERDQQARRMPCGVMEAARWIIRVGCKQVG